MWTASSACGSSRRSWEAAASPVPQPGSISPRAWPPCIKELEERLGTRSLNRTTRRVSPTETGRAYYERRTRLLADLEETDQAVSNMDTAPPGELRVNATPTFGTLRLAPAIAKARPSLSQVSGSGISRRTSLLESTVPNAKRLGRPPLRDASFQLFGPTFLVIALPICPGRTLE